MHHMQVAGAAALQTEWVARCTLSVPVSSMSYCVIDVSLFLCNFGCMGLS